MTVNITRRNEVEAFPRVRTGFHSLDHALKDRKGTIGVPLRSIIEVAGQEGVGKTTFSLSLAGILANKLGRNFTLLDFERQNEDTVSSCLEMSGFSGEVDWASYTDEAYAAKGVRSEAVLDIATVKMEGENPDIVLVDSLAAFAPTAKLEGDLGDANMGRQATVVGDWLDRCMKQILSNKEPTVLIFTNHLHQTFGIKSFVPIYHTSGGQKKGYLSTQRFRLSAVYNKVLTEEGCTLVKGKVDKNRDGFSDRLFYVLSVSGEGINSNLTALYDCLMSKQAKVTSGVIYMDGVKYQNIRKMIASRSDDDLFIPFHNTLKTIESGFSVSDVDVDDKELAPLDVD